MTSRVRRYAITPAALFHVMEQGVAFEVLAGIPKGSTFRGFGHDVSTNAIFIYVEHESFDLVHEAEVCPSGPPIEIARLHDDHKKETP